MSKSKVWSGTRAKVYERDGLRCSYCGVQCLAKRPIGVRTMANLATVDHVIPRAMGGSNSADNLVTACFTCNTQKAKRTAEAYAAWKAGR